MATAGATGGSGDQVRSSFDLTAGGGGRVSALGEGGGGGSRARGSCRLCREREAPRERTLALFAQGRIRRERHPRSADPLCTEISLIPCAKVSCLMAL